jgi:hypothetical protein
MDVYQRRRLVALGGVVVVIGLIVAIASAGGDGGSDITPVTTSTAQAMTKGDFINSADSICAETATTIANLPGTDIADDAQQELDYTKSELQQIRSLPQPEGGSSDLDAFFTALKDQIQSLTKQAEAAQSGDTATLDSLQTQLDAAESNVREAAQAYGFERCGEPGKASTGGGGGTVTTTAPATSTVPAPTTTPVAPTTTTPVTPPSGGSTPGTGGGGGTGGGTGGTGTGGGGGSGGVSG